MRDVATHGLPCVDELKEVSVPRALLPIVTHLDHIMEAEQISGMGSSMDAWLNPVLEFGVHQMDEQP